MANLGDTIAAIVGHRRQLEHVRTARPDTRSPLVETPVFGPNPGDLRMLTYRPKDLTGPAPLVVVLHGCTQTAEGYAQGAGWVSLAQRHGFGLLCPEQKAANNMGLCFNWFLAGDTARDQGEAASIRAMIAKAVASGHVDPQRVFVTGLSAGGGMTSAMLAAYPDVFAGGAIIAGLPFGAAASVQEAFAAMLQGVVRDGAAWGDRVRAGSDHAGPWPRVSIWQGDADTTVNPVNALEIAKQWTDIHGLAFDAARTEQHGRLRHTTWLDGKGRPIVEIQRIAGLGHGAPISAAGPDGCGRAGAFLLEAGISSSLDVARFWGLADKAAAPRAEAPIARPAPRGPEARLSSRSQRTRQIPSGAPDIQSIINAALRRAGLLK